MKKTQCLKKFISGITACIILAISVCQSAVFADDTSVLQKVIVDVKSKIEIPTEVSEFVSDKYSIGDGVEYTLSWSLPRDKEQSEYPENTCNRINVRVNSKGDIENYSKSFINTKNGKSLAKFTNDEYKSMALEWLNKIIPSVVSEYEFSEIYTSVNSSTVRLTFERKKDVYNYCGNSINIQLDKKSGEVTSYRLSHLYTDKTINSNEIIDEKSKRDAFLKKNSFEKFYIRKGDSYNAVLVYVPTNPNVVLDSTNGEIPKLTAEEEKKIKEDKNFYEEGANLKAESISGAGGGSSMATADSAEDAAVELSREEVATIEDYSKLISPEEAEKIIRSLENTVIDEFELASYSYHKAREMDYPVPIFDVKGEQTGYADSFKDVYYAEFHFTKEEENNYFGDASVTINAETGELISMYSYSYNYNDDEKRTALAVNTREKNALAFIKKYSPIEAEKAENFDTNNENPRNFRFNESANGIKYKDNFITVGVDEYSGKITRFSKNWTHGIKFEQADNILSESNVANVLFNKIGFNEYYTNIAYVEYAPAVRLVYEMKDGYPYYVSATSGKLLDYDGDIKTEEEISAEGESFIDIDGHYAEEIINILVENEVLEVGADRMFKPDSNITYEECQKILNTFGYNTYIYESYYREKTGYSLPSKGDATRIGAIECIIEIIGYGNAAKLHEIYNCDFADADIIGENKGYAMIAKALGIVKGDENGCFNPNDNVTRADFAIMVYNLLVSDRVE